MTAHKLDLKPRGAPPESAVLIRMEGVLAVTSLSRTQVEKMMRRGDFPKPRRVSDRVVAWLPDDLKAWAAGLPEAEKPAHELEPVNQ